MPKDDAALADLAEAVGRALIRYADAIRPAVLHPEVHDAERTTPSPRGRLQRATLELAGISDRLGLSAVDIATGVGTTPPNAYKLTERMINAGLLEQVPEVEPRRWRRPSTE